MANDKQLQIIKSAKPPGAISRAISRIVNYAITIPIMKGIKGMPENIPMVKNDAHDPRSFMVPLQLLRLKQDVQTWREAVSEAENAFYPHRFRMQQMYVDTILEGHVLACIDKRKRLSLQKDFKLGRMNNDGKWTEDKTASKIFKDKKWFRHLLGYLLDKKYYGYSLIQLGDLISKAKDDFCFENLTVLKRWNVSPDRKQFVQIPYQTWGINIQPQVYKAHDDRNAITFSEDVDEHGVPFNDWMVYVDTPSDIGSSICGFGLLYNVAIYAIILRNNLGHNADYTQMFAAPYRHIKTPSKYGSEEYNTLEKAASEMGGFGYLLTSDQETVDFISGNAGTGFQSYGDLERRAQSMISKIILGHADAIDSTAGKLGAGQGESTEDTSPVDKALASIEKDDVADLLSDLNDIVLPKLRTIGFPIAEDICFYIPNDKEVFEVRKKEDAANKITADIAQTMKNAGMKMDAKYFTDRTGIPAEEVEDKPEPAPGGFGRIGGRNSLRIQNRLKKIYNES